MSAARTSIIHAFRNCARVITLISPTLSPAADPCEALLSAAVGGDGGQCDSIGASFEQHHCSLSEGSKKITQEVMTRITLILIINVK